MMFISRSWNTWWCMCERVVEGRAAMQCDRLVMVAAWGAYTFIGCKLHCCWLLTLLTHHHNLTFHSCTSFLLNRPKQHDHSCNMKDVYNPHIFMQAVKLLLKAKKIYIYWHIYSILHSLHYFPHLSQKL